MMLCRRALFAAARSARATNTNGSMTAMPIISRSFADDAPAAASDTAKAGSTFAAKWKKVMPNTERPKLSLDNMEARPGVPTAIPTKLTVNFSMPYQVELSSKEVDMVIVPATTGQMGVLPGHVPTVVELKPGLMSVHDGSDVTKYFISSGFAFIHANSYTDIMAVEAVPLDRIDPDQVKANLSEYQQKLAAAATDLEKAEAQIGIELHSTLSAALSG